MQLLFERSHTGRRCTILPACDVAVELPDASLCRAQAPHLPSLSENEISRHYTELAKQTHGVNDGFYPLGSCTMKLPPSPVLLQSTRSSRRALHKAVLR